MIQSELRWPWPIASVVLLGAVATLLVVFRPTEPGSLGLLGSLAVLAVAAGLRRVPMPVVQAGFGLWMVGMAAGSYVVGDTVNAAAAAVAALVLFLVAASEVRSGTDSESDSSV